MRAFTFLSTALLLTASLQAFSATADQSWSCTRDNRATAQRAKANRTDETQINGVKLVIKDSKLADGQILGWENGDNWKFTDPSPEGRNSPYYEAALEAKRSSGDTLVISINSDGWDHYNYTVRLNTRTGQALVDEAIQQDCRNPAASAGVLNCQRDQ